MQDGLNERQLEAVKQIDGSVLVLAGAGSGKTKVLSNRVAYLISKGIDPKSILAITFTNKAAKEMKERIIRLAGINAYTAQISTFHSFGLSIIKDNYEEMGLKKTFTILDGDDCLSVIKKILKELDLDQKIYNPKLIKAQISSAKNVLLTPTEYAKFANTDIEKIVVSVYEKYENKLKISNSLDFDDLLMKPIQMFKNKPAILKQYQEKYKYILIDEYQDTNEAQYILTKMISAKYKNICVVGDPDQSIYAFRGSNYQNILNFEKDYKDTKTIVLDKNYRSTPNILNVANDIIKNNKLRTTKNLWTDNKDGSLTVYHRANDEKEEAYYVVNEIKKLQSNNKLKEFAVLYRTNAQSRNIEEALLKENVPYKIVGAFYFYKRKEIKDLIAYLKLLYNTSDDESLLRIINTPKRGIGTRTIESLITKANDCNKSLYEVIESGKEKEFKDLIEDIKNKLSELSITELVDLVLDKSGIKEELINEKTLESEIRLENLDEFKSITKTYEEKNGFISLEDFLNEISLVSDITEYKEIDDAVTLMTVHSAKGLEFENVFIIGMEEGIFPHANSFVNSNDIEEERRLCYVAVTRAKKRLWLVNSRRRMIYGNDSANPESRFIKEINKQYLEEDKVEKEVTVCKREMINENVDYKVGEKVIHNTFGTGVIVAIQNKILSIAFMHPYGIKMIMKGHKSIRKENE